MLGLGLSVAVSPALTMLLSGVNPHDPASFIVPALVLLLTATAAAYGPALRGANVAPTQALRAE